MPNDPRNGFYDAIYGVFTGIVVSALLVVVEMLFPSYAWVFQLVEVINLVWSIISVFAFESWGPWYLATWLFGMWIMASSGLVEQWLCVLYLVCGIPTLIIKILQWLKEKIRS